MTKFGVLLANALLGTNSLETLLSGSHIRIFSGPVPAAADVAIDGSCVLLDTIDVAGTGVTWAGTIANGVLSKTASETWAGVCAATGVASFFRVCVGSDAGTGAAASGNYRVQGTVGTDITADMQLASVNFVSGANKVLNSAQIALPT